MLEYFSLKKRHHTYICKSIDNQTLISMQKYLHSFEHFMRNQTKIKNLNEPLNNTDNIHIFIWYFVIVLIHFIVDIYLRNKLHNPVLFFKLLCIANVFIVWRFSNMLKLTVESLRKDDFYISFYNFKSWYVSDCLVIYLGTIFFIS